MFDIFTQNDSFCLLIEFLCILPIQLIFLAYVYLTEVTWCTLVYSYHLLFSIHLGISHSYQFKNIPFPSVRTVPLFVLKYFSCNLKIMHKLLCILAWPFISFFWLYYFLLFIYTVLCNCAKVMKTIIDQYHALFSRFIADISAKHRLDCWTLKW